jgi:hypothetical protein
LPHVAIEATIMAPLLVVQIIMFPFIASTMTSYWSNATREVALQEVASQMGSTIEQLYLSLNRIDVSTGTITQVSTFPTEVVSYPYTATGSLIASSEPNSGKILLLNITMQNAGNTVINKTPLGPNVLWNEESVFYSSSPNASIKVQKFANGTLLFSFE